MPNPAPALRVDLARARAHWLRSQGLAGPLKGTIDEVLAATGWLRTLGGIDVYLAARARVPGMRRGDLDEAVEQSRLQVIPAARGCIYLVPRAHVPLALRFAGELTRARSEREMEKVGVPQKEIADIGEAVVAALRKGPLSTDALRRALPEGVVRSLGEKGKKLGVSSPLPPTLRHLEFEGKIERTLEGGRLDTERYAWKLLKKSPFSGVKLASDAAERHAAIAQIFFRHHGPASLKDFAGWAGLPQRDARAATLHAPLAPVAVDGYAEDAFALEEHLPLLREAAPATSALSMLSFEDNYLVVHGGPARLTDPKHHGREVAVWGSTRGTTLGDATHLGNRAVLDGDRVAGLWEYDPDAEAVVYGTFDRISAPRKREIGALAEDLGRFIREEMGHPRSFSLDTIEDVKRRAAQVKAL